jgi:hypothetical protein
MQSALLATLLAAMLRHVSAARCIIGTSGMDLYGREGPFVGSCPTFYNFSVFPKQAYLDSLDSCFRHVTWGSPHVPDGAVSYGCCAAVSIGFQGCDALRRNDVTSDWHQCIGESCNALDGVTYVTDDDDDDDDGDDEEEENDDDDDDSSYGSFGSDWVFGVSIVVIITASSVLGAAFCFLLLKSNCCGLGDYRTQFPSVQIRFSSYSNFSSPRKSVAASDKDSLELEQPLSPKDTAGEV